MRLLAAQTVSGPAGPVPADDVCGVIEHVDVGLIHLCHRCASRLPGDRLLQHLRAGLGVVGGSTGRRCGAPCALADVAAHRGGHRRAGGDTVVRRPDRRCQGISRAVGAGTRRSHDADDPCRSQPAGPSRYPRPAATAQSPASHRSVGGAGRDGLFLVSVALAAAHLLALLHRAPARQLCRRRGSPAGIRVAGIPDHPACRRPITLSGTRRREIAGGGPADSLAAAAASANDRAGICGGTAWRRSYRDLVHVA
ncbi:Uncharacterised protein [Mycobacterium tuberculosis]|nr:Uncharacterised protein [Mycobacterium tuberculosis]